MPPELPMKILVDDLRGPEIARLLHEHLQSMALHSPPESIHALDLEALRGPDITFWCVWQGAELMGCGALKELTPRHGEIKSMRTASRHLRKGVAARLHEPHSRCGQRPFIRETQSRDGLDGCLCSGAEPVRPLRIQALRAVC